MPKAECLPISTLELYANLLKRVIVYVNRTSVSKTKKRIRFQSTDRLIFSAILISVSQSPLSISVAILTSIFEVSQLCQSQMLSFCLVWFSPGKKSVRVRVCACADACVCVCVCVSVCV